MTIWTGCKRFVLLALLSVSLPLVVMAQGCGFFWQPSTPPTTPNDLSGVAWNGTIYVAVGERGTLLTATNTATWTRQPIDTDDYITAVVWGGGQFVATLYYQGTLTSPDGISWTHHAVNSMYTSTSGCSLLYAGGLYLCATQGNLYSSVNGVNWQQASSVYGIYGVAYGGGTYVGVGQNGLIRSSADGLNWTQRRSWTTTTLYAVAYGNGVFVAVGYGGRVLTSPDGINWAVRPSPTFKDLKRITFGNGQFLAWNADKVELASSDGASWTSPCTFQSLPSSAIYDGSNFVAVGAEGFLCTSSDGAVWNLKSVRATNANLNAVTFDQALSLFVAVGDGGAIVTSPDGIAWTARTCATTQNLRAVADGGGALVAVGDGGAIVSSNDGLQWYSYASGTTDSLTGLTYAAGTFVAVGSNNLWYQPTYSVLTSPDGSTWTLESPATSMPALVDVAYGLSQFVAISSVGGVYASPDGHVWTQVCQGPSSLRSIVFADGLFVIENTYSGYGWILSTDALVWYEYIPSAPYSFNASGRLTYHNGQFQTIANYNSVALSPNGVDWNLLTVGCDASFYGLATDGTTTVLVGSRGAILRSACLGVVYSLSPSAGPLSGGNTVVLHGGGFTGATQVLFGDVHAASFTVNSDSQITAVAPAHAAAQMDVTVVTPSGTTPTSDGDRYTWLAPPTITYLSPAYGPLAGGMQVQLGGSNFYPGCTVTFGGVPATQVTLSGDSWLYATCPAHAAGPVDVVVTAPGGATIPGLLSVFTYIPPPVVTSISPSGGPTTGNTQVTITGQNLKTVTSVYFGTASTYGYAQSDTSILVYWTPYHSSGTVDVTVQTLGGTSATNPAVQFTYTDGPVVYGLTPYTGSSSGGTAVTITGDYFSPPSTVKFGSASATNVTVVSPTSITCVSPAGTGTVDVTVTNSIATSPTNSFDLFAYISGPGVTSLSPPYGSTAGGTSVTITGSGFVGGASVTFGGIPATGVSVTSATSLTCQTPAHAAANVDVTVTNPGGASGTLAGGYTYIAPPTLTGVSPTSGPAAGGTGVTLTGTGFMTGAVIAFGSITATNINFVNSTTMTCTTPAHGGGTVSVSVTNPDGQVGTKASAFTYTGSAGIPTVTALSPNKGSTSGGTTVVITGTNLSSVTTVRFGTTSASFTVTSDSSLTAVSPAHAAGSVYVTATSPGGTSANGAGNQFTYGAPPTVTRLIPTRGPSSGGTTVTISGANFTGATAVKFGGVACTSYTVVSAAQITARAPAQAAATVDIRVTTPFGTSASSTASKYVYY